MTLPTNVSVKHCMMSFRLFYGMIYDIYGLCFGMCQVLASLCIICFIALLWVSAAMNELVYLLVLFIAVFKSFWGNISRYCVNLPLKFQCCLS